MGRFMPDRQHWDPAATERWWQENKRRLAPEKKTRAERYADEEAPFASPVSRATEQPQKQEEAETVLPTQEGKGKEGQQVEPRSSQPSQLEALYHTKWFDGELDILEQASLDGAWAPEVRTVLQTLCDAMRESREAQSQEGIARQWGSYLISTERDSFGQWTVKVTPSA